MEKVLKIRCYNHSSFEITVKYLVANQIIIKSENLELSNSFHYFFLLSKPYNIKCFSFSIKYISTKLNWIKRGKHERFTNISIEVSFQVMLEIGLIGCVKIYNNIKLIFDIVFIILIEMAEHAIAWEQITKRF